MTSAKKLSSISSSARGYEFILTNCFRILPGKNIAFEIFEEKHGKEELQRRITTELQVFINILTNTAICFPRNQPR